jgi:hypothetical protein
VRIKQGPATPGVACHFHKRELFSIPSEYTFISSNTQHYDPMVFDDYLGGLLQSHLPTFLIHPHTSKSLADMMPTTTPENKQVDKASGIS